MFIIRLLCVQLKQNWKLLIFYHVIKFKLHFSEIEHM